MKKYVIILFFSLMTVISFAQTSKKTVRPVSISSASVKRDSLIQDVNEWLEQIELDLSLKQRYKLYPTENMYNFLQLDTKTGMIEQVQWSLEVESEGSVTINDEDLTYGYGHGSGSFELCPTKNMYQFILLDKTSGRKWHVQWGFEASKRWIRRIF